MLLRGKGHWYKFDLKNPCKKPAKITQRKRNSRKKTFSFVRFGPIKHVLGPSPQIEDFFFFYINLSQSNFYFHNSLKFFEISLTTCSKLVFFVSMCLSLPLSCSSMLTMELGALRRCAFLREKASVMDSGTPSPPPRNETSWSWWLMGSRAKQPVRMHSLSPVTPATPYMLEDILVWMPPT